LRNGEAGNEKTGIVDGDGNIRGLSEHLPVLGPDALSDESLGKIAKLDISRLSLIDGSTRIGPRVANCGKFICIGLNYSDHAAESGMEVPPEPVVFFKATSAICGPNDNVEIPRGSTATDWEVELGVVIGKYAKYIEEKYALDHVAG